MRYIQDCEIVAHDLVAPDHWRMRLRSADIARAAQPGQFCMVEVVETLYPFLRRPMCLSEIHDDGFTLLYKVEGEGTQLLSRRVPGQTCSIQGPLGNGFPIAPEVERHIIVSGGIGVAAFPALARALADACGRPPEVVLAARTRDLLLCADLFRSMGCTVHLATDDGSAGEKAYAAQMLERLAPGPGTRVYACGPMIMMSTTAAVAARAGASCLVSLEAQMACGDGACLGCVVESKVEREGEKMVRVCVDGPVFDAAIIDWEAHNTAYDL
ncbi:MAG TPA: dihydroorotate dehydrogenase electron transfer subunit [Candidatus Hydrogenedentes bacterium]|jgi:dihydroorotate dehydrogenase electron transfer subunit|nr:dihydroorotate dehydrogenase electron transfer subunit [FCB group bacterium]NLT61041.1 dihydroorotate dehydrogenase electron transfer subunit [Candidatus Hydrogenedentota bacterium]HNZ16869.1 dihydroorotate dehydrogenase electron transfer subunit [Candidatus Hydrogenedentota bacterium]HOH34102.1 dihydroorotate dehydrogenase electron transfer subunit [Candidatus Hydrogenedentota bacterium]HPA06457.1 dihydroorotate dehydrogenase electron transfer subunit [Candidatus Hydrogenedentota bacterium]